MVGCCRYCCVVVYVVLHLKEVEQKVECYVCGVALQWHTVT